MKIYIAGKISGLERKDIDEKFETAKAEFLKSGHQVFIPSVLPAYDEVSHEEYLHICYAMIDICDAIYMLKDWQKSMGARLELQYAADHRKKLLYEDSDTIEDNFPILHGYF